MGLLLEAVEQALHFCRSLEEQTVIAIKAPPETRLEVPDPSQVSWSPHSQLQHGRKKKPPGKVRNRSYRPGKSVEVEQEVTIHLRGNANEQHRFLCPKKSPVLPQQVKAITVHAITRNLNCVSLHRKSRYG